MTGCDSDREMTRVPEDKGEDLMKISGERRMCVRWRDRQTLEPGEQVMSEPGLDSSDEPKDCDDVMRLNSPCL